MCIIPAPFALLPAVVTASVVTMVVIMITTIVITLSCCLFKKHKTISKSANTLIMMSPVTMHVYIEAAKPPTGDVVPVSSNPAYVEITIRSIKLKENTAYATVQPAALPQYENVVMKENNESAVALTDAAMSSHSEEFAMKENSAYAVTQPATPVAPQYDEFVMKENSAYGIAQSAAVYIT